MTLQTIPVTSLNANHVRRMRETVNSVLKHQFDDSRRQTDAEKLLGITPINPAYPPGHVLRYGTNTEPGVTDMTLAIQNCFAANNGAECYLPEGRYLITETLILGNNSVRGDGFEATIIVPSGDFPCFTNTEDEFAIGYTDQFTIEFNGGVKPTDPTGNDQKIGFYFEPHGVSLRSPNFWRIGRVQVRGAWWAYFDESGSYGFEPEQLFMRDCKNGFFKSGTTTFNLSNVIGLNCDKTFQFNNVDTVVMTTCAADGADITSDSVCEFVSVTNLTLNGFQFEGNTIAGDGGCMFSFIDCCVTFNGLTGHANNFEADVGEVVALLRVHSSTLTLSAQRPARNTGPTELTMTGDGDYYHVLATNDAKVIIHGGRWMEPTVISGTPLTRNFLATGDARIDYQRVDTDMTAGVGTHEILNDYSEDTYTLTGFAGADPTGTVRIRRTNQLVTLQLPALSGTSDTASMTLTPALPAGFRPARTQKLSFRLTDNSVLVDGAFTIGTDGSMTFYSSDSEAAITGSGTKGIPNRTVSFVLD